MEGSGGGVSGSTRWRVTPPVHNITFFRGIVKLVLHSFNVLIYIRLHIFT